MVLNTHRLRLIATIAALIAVVQLFALPARPGFTTYTQADGSQVQVRICGDERFHYLLSADDRLVIDIDRQLFYAREDADGMPVASQYRIGDHSAEAQALLRLCDTEAMIQALRFDGNSPRRGPGLKHNATFPLFGDQRAIVILVEYQDVKFRLPDPAAYFHNMLNQPGFSDYGGTGSARDYYLDSSDGQFRPQFDVYGPVTLPHDMVWYGGNVNGSDTDNMRMMVVHACQALDSEIDFTQYDRDGDGIIDNVFLFYAGMGEASSGIADTVWPHSADVLGTYIFDGVTLQHYGCTNEWIIEAGGTGHPDGIGAFCHEFAHILGLPDLYATAYPTPAPFTPGAWSLLDVGPYNNNGRTPPALELFSRYALGWSAPVTLPTDADIILAPIGDCGNGYIIPTSSDEEYFLIENRQKRGWDRYIPGHGMLVWHIHCSPYQWMTNTVNNDASHQYVDIIEADNILTAATRSGDTFPGTANVTRLSASTTPALKAWNGQTITAALSMIAENPDGMVTFKVGQGGTPAEAPVALDATDVNPRGFTAHWRAVEGAKDYRLTVFTTDADGHAVPANGYDGRLTGNVSDYIVTGLAPDTQYKYTVTAVTGESTSAASNAVEVATPALTHEYTIPEAWTSDVTDNGFIINWQPVSGATDYVVNVTRRTVVSPETDTESFDDKNLMWYSNSGYFYSAASYVGAAAPSLRLLPGEYIMSPLADGRIHSFGFWHRGRGDDGTARLLVETYADGCWSLWKSIPLTITAGGAVTTFDNLPADARSVRVRLVDDNGTASVYADDFILTYGGDVTEASVDGYTDKHTGNTNYCRITGLQPGTGYLATVTAVKDGKNSLPSETMFVLTTGQAGIGTVSADKAAVRVNGRTVTVTADGDVEIFDALGRKIASGNAHGSFSAAMPGAGVYIVRYGAHAAKITIR